MSRGLAIVTGASTGIGFELAKLAAQDGYDLIVAADEARIDAAARDVRAFGTRVDAVEVDLSTIEGVDTLLAAAAGRPIDVLIANAGISKGGAVLDRQVGGRQRDRIAEPLAKPVNRYIRHVTDFHGSSAAFKYRATPCRRRRATVLTRARRRAKRSVVLEASR